MSTVKEDEMKGGRMASPPYAPVEEHIRGILQDVRLNPLERCAAIELYYHTDWNTRRLKCRGVIAAHIRRTIGRGQTAAKKTKKKLEELGFIQGDYFDASAWVRSEVTGPKTDRSENRPVRKQTGPKTDHPPSENGPPPVRKQTTPRPKTDHNTSLTSPSSLSLSNPSRPKQRASQEEDRFDDFMNFLENY
jgi:hypothetical protein